MIFKHFRRMLYTTGSCFSGVEREKLGALRKKTGFSFINCKKALELNRNDSVLAEKWLNEQAQSLGWSKVSKLQNRNTSQGLVGIQVKNDIAAMVEVNCETDFVARNDVFKSFVNLVSRTCAKQVEALDVKCDLNKACFDSEKLKHLETDNGSTLSDHLALLIGNLGENVFLKRAVCFKVGKDLKVFGYTHPSPVESSNASENFQVGKYGAITAFCGPSNIELQKNLCQQIIGLNPQKVGNADDLPAMDRDNEPCLIHQEYLLEAEKTVGDILKDKNLTIVDFVRFECGESSDKNLT